VHPAGAGPAHPSGGTEAHNFDIFQIMH
jgi:hypothetical protein